MPRPLASFLSALSILCFSALVAHPQNHPLLPIPGADRYNFVVGTQTIGAAYGFTREDRLVETAREILKMGSSTLKFSLPRENFNGQVSTSLTEVARDNPAVRTVLQLPFSSVLMWAYPVKSPSDETTSPQNLAANYRELYDLTRYLLTTFKGSDKTFYLGNWEGDWHLLHTNPDYVPSEREVQNAIAWVNIRQKAIDDAKRDTPHRDVTVYHYLEVNRVQDAMQGKSRLANRVLPHTSVDFVSYSAYDSLDDIEKQLPAALDFLAARLAPKPGLLGKRVWIGEYGFPAARFAPEEQDARSRRVMRVALQWGCPFALYWAFYNNEVADGQQQGFWMVNDRNEQQPIYCTHLQFLRRAQAFVSTFQRTHKRTPSPAEFANQAATWLAPDSAQK